MIPMVLADLIMQSLQVLHSGSETPRHLAWHRGVAASVPSFDLERARMQLDAIARTLRGAEL